MSIEKINELSRHNASLSTELKAAASRVIDSGWYALGPEVAQFETAFASYCGAAYAVGVGNGTDALELALRAVGVQAGDEVITVANAGFYSSTAIHAIGAVPVYADIGQDSFLLCPVDAAQRVTNRTRAIIVTHLFGELALMPALVALAQQHGIALVEDCAQAHGAERDGRRAGSYGDVAAFSFFPTKNLGALGDGGAVVTNRDEVAQRVRSLRQYGWTSKYTVADSAARNTRLDELQAALLSVKLPHLDQWNSQRRAVARRYAEQLVNPAISKPHINGADHVAHLYVIRCEQRDALKQYLQQQGVGCDIHYPVLDYQQPAYAAQQAAISLPCSESMSGQILTLPCYPELALADVDRIAEIVNGWSG